VIRYDDDLGARTLEPQLLKANGREKVNKILGKQYATDGELLKFMGANKTEVALAFFETEEAWAAPPYIEAAIA
jgi:putative ATP-dependent endonuclease of OLD family